MALTVKEVQAAEAKEKDFKLADEKGLFLLIKKNGAKYWRMKYRFKGKEKLLSFGVYPEIGLKEARGKRDKARKMLVDGIDPSAHKKAQKASEKLDAGKPLVP